MNFLNAALVVAGHADAGGTADAEKIVHQRFKQPVDAAGFEICHALRGGHADIQLAVLQPFSAHGDLGQLFLLLVGSCHVVKGRLALLVVGVLDLCLAKAHFAAAESAAAHAPHKEDPCADKDDHHDDRRDQIDQQRIVAGADQIVGRRFAVFGLADIGFYGRSPLQGKASLELLHFFERVE